jgi:hypothetical protein
MEIKVEPERKQLLDHWKNALRKNPDWVVAELPVVRKILDARNSGSEELQQSIRSDLRYFHDSLGYKAKDTLDKGGLCAGAIFRTEKFIETAQRSGARGAGKTAHIEHTVPINNLETAIINSRFSGYSELLVWLLKHSVTTAFHEHEKKFLAKKEHHSNALNLASVEYQKPFMRYQDLFRSGGVVWNVLDGTKIDPHAFTFEDHLAVVIKLLKKVEAPELMLAEIQRLS